MRHGNERMTDTADFARDLQAEFNKRGVEMASAAAAAETHPDFDGVHCVDCSLAVHPDRLALGRMRCVCCQIKKEKKR